MLFDFKNTPLKGLLIIQPKVFGDERGFFMETYKKSEFTAAGISEEFNQDNHSFSSKGVLRGIHSIYITNSSKTEKPDICLRI